MEAIPLQNVPKHHTYHPHPPAAVLPTLCSFRRSLCLLRAEGEGRAAIVRAQEHAAQQEVTAATVGVLSCLSLQTRASRGVTPLEASLRSAIETREADAYYTLIYHAHCAKQRLSFTLNEFSSRSDLLFKETTHRLSIDLQAAKALTDTLRQPLQIQQPPNPTEMLSGESEGRSEILTTEDTLLQSILQHAERGCRGIVVGRWADGLQGLLVQAHREMVLTVLSEEYAGLRDVASLFDAGIASILWRAIVREEAARSTIAAAAEGLGDLILHEARVGGGRRGGGGGRPHSTSCIAEHLPSSPETPFSGYGLRALCVAAL